MSSTLAVVRASVVLRLDAGCRANYPGFAPLSHHKIFVYEKCLKVDLALSEYLVLRSGGWSVVLATLPT